MAAHFRLVLDSATGPAASRANSIAHRSSEIVLTCTRLTEGPARDRYSEREESAEELLRRVNLSSAVDTLRSEQRGLEAHLFIVVHGLYRGE